MDNILSNYGYKYIYVLLNRINSIYVLIYCSANKHCLIPVSYPVILLDVVSCITILKSANKKKKTMIFVLFLLFTMLKKCISNDLMKFECQSWSYNHDTELTVLYYVDKAPSGFCLFRFKITVKIFFKVGFFLFSNFFQTYTVPDVYHIHFRS